MNRALSRVGQRPPPELPQHVEEDAIAAGALRIERGEVLREAFANPLLVVVLPADCLAPPLVSQFVREEELREALERRRVAAPVHGRKGLRCVQDGEVPRAMAAG